MMVRKYGELEVMIFDTREELGRNAAADAAACILDCLNEKETVNCIFAAAPSQNEFLETLAGWRGIPWERINAFHMDEYIGLKQKDCRSFSGFLSDAIFDRVPFRSVNLLDGMAEPETECARYSALLRQYPADIVFMGVGENGHIAFNDPPADFDTREAYKVVDLDKKCRMQQVGEGWFSSLEDTPAQAVSMTPYQIMQCRCIVSVVPDGRKAEAIRNTLENEGVSNEIPATLLKEHKEWYLYLDRESAAGFLAVR